MFVTDADFSVDRSSASLSEISSEMTLEPLLNSSLSSAWVDGRFILAGRVGRDNLGDLDGRPEGLRGGRWVGFRL